MIKSIQEIQKTLAPFTQKGITRTPLNDYAIIGFPRGIMDSVTPKMRKKIENKYDKTLSDNKIRKNFYIHFEMCTRKCSGCHYGTVTCGNRNETVKAILDHIDLFPSRKYFLDKSGIYFGGGTPSLMNIKQIKSIYNKIINKFNIKNITETTLEVHPEIVKIYKDPKNYIEQLKDIGITRISLGMQECDDKILKKWGRGHTKNDAIKVYKLFKEHKFKTGIDLMWNLPNQTFKDLKKSLKIAFALGPEVVCTYFFWLRPGTKDYDLYKKGKLALMNKPIEMKCLIKSIASEYGYKQRKPEWFHKEKILIKRSNFEKNYKKETTVDNINHASIGFGPSTYSFLFSGFDENYILWSPVPRNIKDSSANNNYRKMIDLGLKPYNKVLIFGKEETIRLYIMFKLRAGTLTKKELDYFVKESTNKEIETLVNNYIRHGLLTWKNKDVLAFTDAGDMMPNHIIASFTTDEWLTKIMKRRNEKEDKYLWFPDPKIVLKLKNIVKK